LTKKNAVTPSYFIFGFQINMIIAIPYYYNLAIRIKDRLCQIPTVQSMCPIFSKDDKVLTQYEFLHFYAKVAGMGVH